MLEPTKRDLKLKTHSPDKEFPEQSKWQPRWWEMPLILGVFGFLWATESVRRCVDKIFKT